MDNWRCGLCPNYRRKYTIPGHSPHRQSYRHIFLLCHNSTFLGHRFYLQQNKASPAQVVINMNRNFFSGCFAPDPKFAHEHNPIATSTNTVCLMYVFIILSLFLFVRVPSTSFAIHKICLPFGLLKNVTCRSIMSEIERELSSFDLYNIARLFTSQVDRCCRCELRSGGKRYCEFTGYSGLFPDAQ